MTDKPKPTGWHVESCGGYDRAAIRSFGKAGWKIFAVTKSHGSDPKIWWRKRKDIP